MVCLARGAGEAAGLGVALDGVGDQPAAGHDGGGLRHVGCGD